VDRYVPREAGRLAANDASTEVHQASSYESPFYLPGEDEEEFLGKLARGVSRAAKGAGRSVGRAARISAPGGWQRRARTFRPPHYQRQVSRCEDGCSSSAAFSKALRNNSLTSNPGIYVAASGGRRVGADERRRAILLTARL
jgi:hypothetical protein